MLRPILALAVLVGLSGCAELGYANGPWGDATRYPSETRRAPTYGGRADDYSRTNEYRRVRSDAAAYANYVDRNLRLNGRDEARIRDVVERRAVDLLRRTAPRSHSRVYPFPRQNNRNGSFWNAVDRDVERVIGRQYRDDYRSLVRYGEVRRQDRTRTPDRRYQTRDRDRGRDRYDDGERRDRDQRRGREARRGDDRRGRDARRSDDRRRDNRGRDARRTDDRRQDGRDARRSDDRRQGESLEDWYRRQQREHGDD